MAKSRKPIDYSALNPGIRCVVQLLRETGYETVSSGDGRTHECECDADYPFVSIRVRKPKRLTHEARRLARLLGRLGLELGEWTEGGVPQGVIIDATYFVPLDEANLQLIGLDDEGLSEASPGPEFAVDWPFDWRERGLTAGGDGGGGMTTPIDIGHGVTIELFYVEGQPAGLVETHVRPDDGKPCSGSLAFEGHARMRSQPTWRVVSLAPLTLEPSILCRACGHHGFIRDGRWEPA